MNRDKGDMRTTCVPKLRLIGGTDDRDCDEDYHVKWLDPNSNQADYTLTEKCRLG